MTDRYIEHHRIVCYDTDRSKRMKPVSFMNYAQEMANRHADILGFGYDDLIASNTAWVLSRIHIRFLNIPHWRDEVDIHTWHKGPKGLFFLRDFCMYGADGNPAVLATTSWIIMNIDSRRISRDPEHAPSTDSERHVDAIGEPCAKVVMPKDAEVEEAGEHVVAYSDLDMNGHANNAMYIVWAMDVLDSELLETRSLRDLRINFNAETRLGDKVSLLRSSRTSDDGTVTCWVEGVVDGRQSFITEFIF
ncbi:MAG: hypothetical protein HUJ94_08180 [Bacteroidales bacterium]|nr:hypothetical protein [Bacteroidales bacterium]